MPTVLQVGAYSFIFLTTNSAKKRSRTLPNFNELTVDFLLQQGDPIGAIATNGLKTGTKITPQIEQNQKHPTLTKRAIGKPYYQLN